MAVLHMCMMEWDGSGSSQLWDHFDCACEG